MSLRSGKCSSPSSFLPAKVLSVGRGLTKTLADLLRSSGCGNGSLLLLLTTKILWSVEGSPTLSLAHKGTIGREMVTDAGCWGPLGIGRDRRCCSWILKSFGCWGGVSDTPACCWSSLFVGEGWPTLSLTAELLLVWEKCCLHLCQLLRSSAWHLSSSCRVRWWTLYSYWTDQLSGTDVNQS